MCKTSLFELLLEFSPDLPQTRAVLKNRYGNILRYLFTWYTYYMDFQLQKSVFWRKKKNHVLNGLWITASAPVGVAVRLVGTNCRVPFLAEWEMAAACRLIILERRLQNIKPMCGWTSVSKTNQGAWTWIKQMQFANSVTLPWNIQVTQPTCELTSSDAMQTK